MVRANRDLNGYLAKVEKLCIPKRTTNHLTLDEFPFQNYTKILHGLSKITTHIVMFFNESYLEDIKTINLK